MPANITHMLIAHKALQTLKAKGVPEYEEFANLLEDTSDKKNYKAYYNLGSLGPDLYYYGNMTSSVKDMLTEGFVQAKGVTPWAYHLHSYRPNVFPLRLVEVIFSDVIRENGKVQLYEDDYRKLAYVAGHLTHIAADQIIHPVVNSVAGPYYRSGENRKKHRECEVFQDYFLYTEVYRIEEKSGAKYDFFKQDFRKWADCVSGLTFKNAEEWFRYFLQRGFVETYGSCPEEKDIENSVDNILLTLRVCQQIGPYKTADKEYQKDKENSKMYQEYIKNVDYIKFYRLAIELAVVYLIALYEIYFVLKEGKDFTDKHQKRFLKIVSDADLSCPLEHNIFDNASAALKNERNMESTFRKHSFGLLNQTKFFTAKNIFKSVNEKDILQK
jgi:hypothetical protein